MSAVEYHCQFLSKISGRLKSLLTSCISPKIYSLYLWRNV